MRKPPRVLPVLEIASNVARAIVTAPRMKTSAAGPATARNSRPSVAPKVVITRGENTLAGKTGLSLG